MEAVLLGLVLMLSIFLGFELISKVPATLHTPLMSGANAISGITIVGALISAGAQLNEYATILGGLAVMFAAINVVGGYLVTNRMLSMFKKKKMISRGKTMNLELINIWYVVAAALFILAQTAWVTGYGCKRKYAFFLGDVDCRCSDSVQRSDNLFSVDRNCCTRGAIVGR